MNTFKQQTKNWQQLISACQLAPFSKINQIIFKDGQPVSFGDIEETVLFKNVANGVKPSLQDFELKMQWINFIQYAKKRGDFTINVLSVQSGLPEKVDTKRPDIHREFSQIK